jgi:hypothetical protein
VIRRGLVVALCAALMAGACSGGDDDGSGRARRAPVVRPMRTPATAESALNV